MRTERGLGDQLRQLRHETNPQRRGFALEKLAADILRRAHFNVSLNPGAARPRQTDLIATDGRDAYLVETKWLKRSITVGDIDALHSRLARTSPAVIGVLITASPLTSEAKGIIVTQRARPVVVVSDDELTEICEWPPSIRRILRRRHRVLVEEGKLELRTSNRFPRRTSIQAQLPSSPRNFVTPELMRSSSIMLGGGYDDTVFVTDLPDPDWGRTGGAVSLEVSVPVETVDDVLGSIAQLATHGWVSDASWALKQATASWHGLGANSCADALDDWRSRYRELPTQHHTEQLLLADSIDGGLLTLSADISASAPRRVSNLDLALQLDGIPLDPHPLAQLLESMGVEHDAVLRPLQDRAVVIGGISAKTRVPLAPVGLVVQVDDDNELWVRGIVANNPFKHGLLSAPAHPERWPDALRDTDYLICDLRSWHPLDRLRDEYWLRSFETTWSGRVHVAHVTADW